jgi:glyoxylase-like metal-dependent hydrolase (beta-lactamase superfamily II)
MVGEFRVIHVPGQIALWRAHDRVLLAADSIYTIDFETAQAVPARVPHPAVNWDTQMARASIGRLADLGPLTVWAGHSEHVAQNAQEQLRTAAENN